MKDRSTSLVVFADLAFFLFAILAFGYHYMDQTSGQRMLQEMQLQLPILQERARAEASPPDNPFVIHLGPDGSIRLDGQELAADALDAALEARRNRHARLLADRACTAEQLVRLLDHLNRHDLLSLTIGYEAPPQ